MKIYPKYGPTASEISQAEVNCHIEIGYWGNFMIIDSR